jgi:hypothetical protein
LNWCWTSAARPSMDLRMSVTPLAKYTCWGSPSRITVRVPFAGPGEDAAIGILEPLQCCLSYPIAEIVQIRSCSVTPTLLCHPAFLKALNLLTPVLVTYVSHLFTLRIHYGKSLPRVLVHEYVGIS